MPGSDVRRCIVSSADMALASKERMPVDWKLIDLPRWYDCKLGRMKDQALAKLVGRGSGSNGTVNALKPSTCPQTSALSGEYDKTTVL